MAFKRYNNNTDQYRKQELGKIHALKNSLNLDDDTYRAVLVAQTGLQSSAEMNRQQRLAVIDHFKTQLGFVMVEGRPHTLASNQQLKKIEALLINKGKPWAYAHSLAKKMYKKETLVFCTPAELRGIITALSVGGKRKKKATR